MNVPSDLFLSSLLGNDFTDATCPPLAAEDIIVAEKRLGVKLPAAYLDVLRVRNGGLLRRCLFARDSSLLEEDRSCFFVPMFYGIGGTQGIDADVVDAHPYLSGRERGICVSENIRAGWGFPDECVVICFGCHTGFLLDYRQCGPTGEPSIIYADAECYPNVEVRDVAPTFADLCAGLTEYHEDGTSVWQELLADDTNVPAENHNATSNDL